MNRIGIEWCEWMLLVWIQWKNSVGDGGIYFDFFADGGDFLINNFLAGHRLPIPSRYSTRSWI